MSHLSPVGAERPIGYRSPLPLDRLHLLHMQSKYYLNTCKIIAELEMKLSLDKLTDHKRILNSRNEDDIDVTSPLLSSDRESSILYLATAAFSNYRDVNVFFPTSLAMFYIILERAIKVKLGEKEVIVKTLVSTIVTSAVVGLLAYGTGSYGKYCLGLLGMPYAETFNMIAVLFLLTSVLFSMQILSIHIVCQKLQIYRYEQRKGYCSLLSFWFATICAECLFGLIYFIIYSSIIYFMTSLASGYSKFLFFVALHSVITVVAVTTALAFAAFFRKEFLIRDMYLCWFFLMTMFSGYPVHIPYFFLWAQRMSILNPLKWAYQGTFVWKFENYEDHDQLLSTYGFNNWDK